MKVEWNEWKSALQEAAETVLGHKRGHRENWISDYTWLLIKEKKDLKMKMKPRQEREDFTSKNCTGIKQPRSRERHEETKGLSITKKLIKRRVQPRGETRGLSSS